MTYSRFKPGATYPRDGAGVYIEYSGHVTSVSANDYGEVLVGVEVPLEGKIYGMWSMPQHSPPIGCRARIRVYEDDAGVDNMIVGWSDGTT